MRLYGALSELASLVIRLASGKTVTVKSAEQQQQDIEVTIPDVGGSTQKEFLMIETTTAQPLKSKTINFMQNTITAGTLDITALKADAAVGNQVLQKNPSTGVIEAVLLTNANIASNAQIADTKLAKITSANKVDSGAVQAVQGDNGRVLSFDANGAPSAALISNVNIAADALIAGSKIADLPASSLALMPSADLAGRITDETGSGALVFGTGPTLTNAKVSGYEDFNHTTTPGSNPTGAVRVYAKSDNKLYTLSPAGIEQAVGSGGTVDLVNQTAHGFAIGDVLWLDPGNPPTIPASYKKAKADAANTAEVVGVVSRTLGADSFELTLSGEVSGLSGLTAGEVYFLSASTAGALTVTEPSVVGQVSLPVGVASSDTTLYVAPKRGVVVGAANARTTIAVSNNSATNVVSVTNYNSLKLEGELNVTRSSGGNQRAYYTVEAAKNGAGVWQVSASYTGDDVNVGGTTALPSWDVAANNLQITMPLIPTNTFLSASLTYSLNAPAVGASLPLSIDSSSLNIVDSAPLSYRNRIINGDMRIDQRNAGAAVSILENISTLKNFIVDRYHILASKSGKLTAQQNPSVVSMPSGFTNYLGVTSNSAYTVLQTDYFQLKQVIEGYNISDLNWGSSAAKAVTLSFWARSSLIGTFSGAIRNPSFNRSYVFTYSVSAANTWEYKTVTIPGCTDGQWGTVNDVGFEVVWNLGAGSDFATTTAGVWNTNSYAISVAGAQSVVGTNGATFYLTGVQLEVGSKASAFERRPYQQELALCQRYLPAVNATASLAQNAFIGYVQNANIFRVPITFKVSSRVPPTGVSFSSAGHFAVAFSGSGQTCTSVAYTQGGTESSVIEVGVTSASVGTVGYWYTNNASALLLFTGCEL